MKVKKDSEFDLVDTDMEDHGGRWVDGSTALARAQPLSVPRHNSLLAIVAELCDWLMLATFILRGTLEHCLSL